MIGFDDIDADVFDLRRAVSALQGKQRQVVDAALANGNRHDIGFTEKEWRYHFGKAIEQLKKDMT